MTKRIALTVMLWEGIVIIALAPSFYVALKSRSWRVTSQSPVAGNAEAHDSAPALGAALAAAFRPRESNAYAEVARLSKEKKLSYEISCDPIEDKYYCVAVVFDEHGGGVSMLANSPNAAVEEVLEAMRGTLPR